MVGAGVRGPRDGRPMTAAPAPPSTPQLLGARISAVPRDPQRKPRGIGSAATTLLTATGSGLAMMPIAAIFTDWTWLLEAWLALACAAAAMAALRIGRRAVIADDAVGVIVTMGFLVIAHLSEHALGGVIPTTATMHDLTATLNRASDLIATSRPPVESTASLRLVTTASLVGAALAIDIMAVVLRARAAAGLIVLALITAGTSIARAPIGIFPFIAATAGYVLILAAGAARERREWVEAAPVHGSESGAGTTQGLAAVRVATLAMVVALIAPIFTPIAANTRLSGLFTSGGGAGVALSPFAKLQGSLNQTEATPLLRVTTSMGATEPYYLRDIVLDTYSSEQGWTTSDSGRRGSLEDPLRQDPPAGPLTGDTMAADVEILDLSDSSAPTFGTLIGISGLGSSWRWNATTATVSGGVTRNGGSYHLDWVQPELTADQLRSASGASPQDLVRWLKLPDDVPTPVLDQARQIVADASTPFDKALKLHQFFLDPANGFQYSTTTTTADTGDGLTDFLISRQGFCQQYAGAMAVMARQVGLPARIVLGYTHDAPDADGTFVVTSHDAHAWVEIYFDGLGWVPFDPTPLSGADAARAVPLNYAPGNGASDGPDDPATPIDSGTTLEPDLPQELVPDEVLPDSGPLARPRDAESGGGLVLALAIGAALVVLLAPAATRAAQRRRRILLARRAGTSWPWWEEFRATARDLGVTWPAATTLREAPAAIGAALRARTDSEHDMSAAIILAAAAERERFGPAGDAARPADPQGQRAADAAARAIRGLRRARGIPTRVRAWWLPASTLRPAAHRMTRGAQMIIAAPGSWLRRLGRRSTS